MKFKVVGIGEVLWDLLPAGPQLGGAPANFACHAKMLGAQAQVITRIGDDDFGREILRRMDTMGVDLGAVQLDGVAPTGRAVVSLKVDGVPQFAIQEDVAWDYLEFTDKARQVVQGANAVCFGSLAQRRKSAFMAVQKLVAQASPDTLKVFDANLRQDFYCREVIEQSLEMAGVLKLNDQELAILARMFKLGDLPKRQIECLADRFNLSVVVLTLGRQGSVLHQSGKWSELPGSSVRVSDTIGAGDSFTAALVMGLLCGMPLKQIHRAAADVAAFVCSQPGATPVLPENLRRLFTSHIPEEQAKIRDLASSEMK